MDTEATKEKLLSGSHFYNSVFPKPEGYRYFVTESPTGATMISRTDDRGVVGYIETIIGRDVFCTRPFESDFFSFSLLTVSFDPIN